MSIESVILGLLANEAKKIGKKMMEDQPDYGHWAGTYTDKKISKNRWSFVNDITADPLRFCHKESGFEFAAESLTESDRGSIPRLFRAAPRKYLRLYADDFLESYYTHDSMIYWGWCWVRKAGGEWNRMKVTKKQADVFLYWMLSAPTLGDPPISATRGEATAIYRACRLHHALRGS